MHGIPHETQRNDHGGTTVVAWRTLPRAEQRFALFVSAALVICTILPYVAAWLRTPPTHVATGLSTVNSLDVTVYLGYIEQIRDGQWRIVNQYAPEGAVPTLNPFWLGVGLVARTLHLTPAVAFHGVRLLLIVPFTMFLAVFVTEFLPHPIGTWSPRVLRRIALLCIAGGSGMSAILRDLPGIHALLPNGTDGILLDLHVPEATTFLTLYHSPHAIASLWLLLAVLLALLRFDRTRRMWHAVAAGIAACALLSFHPYYAATIAGVLLAWGVMSAVRERRVPWHLVRGGAIIAACTLPAVAFYAASFAADPTLGGHAARIHAPMPVWWVALLSVGALAPLACIGAIAALRRNHREVWLLIAWVATAFTLAYAPMPAQRKFLASSHVALALLATIGLAIVLPWLRARLPRRAVALGWTRTTALFLAVPLFGFSPLAVLATDLAHAIDGTPSQRSTLVAYPRDAVAAMQWIRAHTQARDVTLAVGVDADYFPRYANRTVTYGSWERAGDAAARRAQIAALTAGTLALQETRAVLQALRVRYVLITNLSRHHWAIAPATLPGARLAYANGSAEVYEITLP